MLVRQTLGRPTPMHRNADNLFPVELATTRTRANIAYTLMWGMQSKVRNTGCKANEQHHHMRVRKEDT
jgi:hypothetical protein